MNFKASDKLPLCATEKKHLEVVLIRKGSLTELCFQDASETQVTSFCIVACRGDNILDLLNTQDHCMFLFQGLPSTVERIILDLQKI